MMDYKEKYDAALERAREQYNKRTPLYDIESIFPELLTEDEDERIRKALVKQFSDYDAEETFYCVKNKDILAWLEKQKEFVSADFDDVWETADCDELTAPLEKYSKDAIKKMCHAWYDKGIELERRNWLNQTKQELEQEKSEDERIRKELIQLISYMHDADPRKKDWIAWLENQNLIKEYEKYINWLEKQGEKKSADEVLKIRQELYQSGYNDGYKHGQEDMANKEYVFRPVAGTMIENAVEQALKQGDVVLAFNGFYTPVKGKTSDEILAEYNRWIDKQSTMCKLIQIGRKYCELLNSFVNK